jgi:predicted TPR repeat methyltransferase
MTDLFNEKATDWDADDMVQQLSTAISSEIIKQVSPDKSMHVMDFGAGTGLICSHIAPLVNKITAVDISQAMLNKLIEKPELKDKVETVCQNIIDEPLKNHFDLIVSAMAMHHVEFTEELIQRFSEHSKSGARIALADLDKEDGSFHPADIEGVFHHGFEQEELFTILDNNGFIKINFQTVITVNKDGKNYPIFLVIATKK